MDIQSTPDNSKLQQKSKTVQFIGSLKSIIRSKEMGWGRNASIMYFKGSKRYIDILNKKLSSKAGLISTVLNIVFELD